MQFLIITRSRNNTAHALRFRMCGPGLGVTAHARREVEKSISNFGSIGFPTGPCPATLRVTWSTTVSSSPTPVSDSCVLPTLEHSLSVGRATFLELDICRSRTTSLEQLPPNLTTMWAVIRPVHAVTEDSNIRTVRPRRSVNCF